MACNFPPSPVTTKTPTQSQSTTPAKKLTKTQLDKMKKDEVVKLLQQTEKERDQFQSERDTLLQQVNAISTQYQQVKEENRNLKEDIAQLRTDFTSFKEERKNDIRIDERIIQVERKLYANEQYNRRECVELFGFIDINNENVEAEAISLLNKIGVNVTAQDFHATHKLKNLDVIIMKAVNRKTISNILKNKHKLKELNNNDLNVNPKKVYINESLCPYYRKLLGKCNALFKLGKLANFYTINGTLTIKLTTDKDPITITHLNDLVKLFGKDQINSLDRKKLQKK